MIPQRQLTHSQAELLKQIQALSLRCCYCKQSEEDNRVQILPGDPVCYKNICYPCFKKHKNDICHSCAKRIEEHFPKNAKVKHHAKTIEEARKVYNRQKALWSIQEYQNLDVEFVGLLAYFNANHPQTSSRKKYADADRQLKNILKMKFREQRGANIRDGNSGQLENKLAQLISRTKNDNATGIQTCGHDRTYSKGLSLIARSFKF